MKHFKKITRDELLKNNEVSYLFMMENEKKKEYVRINTDGDLSIIKKIKK